MTDRQKVRQVLAVIRREGWAAIAGDLSPELAAAFRAAGVATLAKYKVGVGFDVVDQRAVKYADERSARLVKMLSDSTRELLRGTISKAIQEGWSVGRLRDELVDHYAFHEARALNIARTEVRTARGAGFLEGAKAAGRTTKVWVLGEGACDICQANAGAGEIPIDEPFPSGDQHETAHPGCGCTVDSPQGEKGDLDDQGENEDAA